VKQVALGATYSTSSQIERDCHTAAAHLDEHHDELFPASDFHSQALGGFVMRQNTPTFVLDARLRAIARTQLGLITTTQAIEAGVDKHALDRRREAGALLNVFGDVLRLDPMPPTPLQRVLAASLAVPGSVVAATSAALIHGMPLPKRIIEQPIVVLSSTKGQQTTLPEVKVFRHQRDLPSVRWMNTRVASPAATVLLLPRFVDDLGVEKCLDHMLAYRLASIGNLSTLIESLPYRSVHGRKLLLELVAARSAGMGHRSGVERKVRGWLNAAGLGGWTPNYCVDVGNGEEVEVDFGWEADRLALEASPFATHGPRLNQERDAKRRQLLVLAGWRVVEALDPDLANQRAFAECAATLRTLLGR
jgi:hypothetical protein